MSDILNTGSPLRLDTAQTAPVDMYGSGILPGKDSSSGVNFLNSIYVFKILFNAAAAGDAFTILDASGNVIVNGKAWQAGSNSFDFVGGSQQRGSLILNATRGWYLSAITASDVLWLYYNL
jgi:hypothetical protein